MQQVDRHFFFSLQILSHYNIISVCRSEKNNFNLFPRQTIFEISYLTLDGYPPDEKYGLNKKKKIEEHQLSPTLLFIQNRQDALTAPRVAKGHNVKRDEPEWQAGNGKPIRRLLFRWSCNDLFALTLLFSISLFSLIFFFFYFPTSSS